MAYGLGRQECDVCGERFAPQERYLRYGGSWTSGGSKAYHFHCADYEIAGSVENGTEWLLWKLQQVEEGKDRDLVSLRSRTTALYNLALQLMEQAGWTKDEVEDFKYEYGYRQQGADEDSSVSTEDGESEAGAGG